MALKALFYPDVPDVVGRHGNIIRGFDTLYIPYIYKEIYFDNVYTDILNGKKDMTIMDVGANIGVVTQYMRDYAKKVYSIEPSTAHFEALKRNKEFNHWDNVELFNMALADNDGEMTLHTLDNNKTCHSLTNDYGKGGEQVKTMRFDTFMKDNNIEQVDFCKFDVEGAEDMILRSEGFLNVADKVKAIEIEFHHPTFPELVKHMMNLGYQARRYNCSAIVILFTR
jgi:FkbM family methyltransferase